MVRLASEHWSWSDAPRVASALVTNEDVFLCWQMMKIFSHCVDRWRDVSWLLLLSSSCVRACVHVMIDGVMFRCRPYRCRDAILSFICDDRCLDVSLHMPKCCFVVWVCDRGLTSVLTLSLSALSLSLTNKFFISWQVLRGGNKDVDVQIISPNGMILYEKQKSGRDEVTFIPSNGEFKFCFGNEFSQLSDKVSARNMPPQAGVLSGKENM